MADAKGVILFGQKIPFPEGWEKASGPEQMKWLQDVQQAVRYQKIRQESVMKPATPFGLMFNASGGDNASGKASGIMAGVTGAVDQIPIAGPWLMNKVDELATGGYNAMNPNADAQAAPGDFLNAVRGNEAAHPEAATAGRVVGGVGPYLAAGMVPLAAKALGLEGTIGSRLGMTALSQGAINTLDNKMRGGENESWSQAAQDAILPTLGAVAAAPFGKGTTASSARAKAGRTLMREGIPLTGGQRTGSRALRFMEEELGGFGAQAFNEKQLEALTQTAFKRAGFNAKRADTDTVKAAKDALGAEFDRLSSATTAPIGNKARSDLIDVVNNYENRVGPGVMAPVIEREVGNLIDLASKNGGTLTGAQYSAARSRIGAELDRATDPQIIAALDDIQNILDQAVEQGMSVKTAREWQAVRRKYANLIVIRDAVKGGGVDRASGLLTPAALRQAVEGNLSKWGYATGKGDLNELSRAAVEVMQPLANSNTAGRNAAQNLYGMGAGGLIGGGAGYQSSGGDTGTALAGAALGAGLGAAGRSAIGSTLLSGPGRSILAQGGTQIPSALVRGGATIPANQQNQTQKWLAQNYPDLAAAVEAKQVSIQDAVKQALLIEQNRNAMAASAPN